jgi:hypothetical protein
MKNRFIFRMLVLGLGIALLALSQAAPAWSQSSSDRNVMDPNDPNRETENQFTEYERQLNAILKTRRDQEKLFVSQVVEKLKQDKLPIKLVDTSFEWVRNKRPYTDHPFYYFERVLRLEAAKLGLEEEVPPFDYSKVGVTGIGEPGQQLNAGFPTERQRSSLFSRIFRFPGFKNSD